MVFGIGKKKVKPPAEAVQAANDAIRHIRSSLDDKTLKKANEELDKAIFSIKCHLFGDEEHETTQQQAYACTVAAVKAGLLDLLVRNMESLDFEHRKDAAQIFGAVVRMKDPTGNINPGAAYVESNPQILETLLKGYTNNHIAIQCGSMLRDCMRSGILAALTVSRPGFWSLFQHMENPAFEIASDAFATFKDALVKHPESSAGMVHAVLERFMDHYMALIRSENYVVKRQSLHLLGDILGLPDYLEFTLHFINQLEHLMLIMNLMRDPLRHIAYEAFVVFKSFVTGLASGSVTNEAVGEVLRRNRDKLVSFISSFQVERDSEDEAFAEDREFILRLIGQIEQADKMPGGEGQAKDEGGRMQDSAREKEPAQDNA